jgi:hypothetical protein
MTFISSFKQMMMLMQWAQEHYPSSITQPVLWAAQVWADVAAIQHLFVLCGALRCAAGLCG